MKKLYLYLFLFLSWEGGFANDFNQYKYAGDIEVSIKYWNNIQKEIYMSFVPLYSIKNKNIYLVKEVNSCYKKINTSSDEDDIIKCFSYDYLSYLMGLQGIKIDNISNKGASALFASENSIGSRLYEGLLKIGLSRNKINSLFGGYFLAGRKPIQDFFSYKRSSGGAILN